MKKRLKSVPDFTNEDEERQFWEQYDSSDYLDWKQLHSDWRSITGDSTQLDCKPLFSAEHAARYIAKYITKAPSVQIAFEPSMAREWYHALKGRRLLIPFGKTSRHRVESERKHHSTTTLGKLEAIIKAAKLGCNAAKTILTTIHLQLRPYERPKAIDIDQPNLPFPKHPP